VNDEQLLTRFYDCDSHALDALADRYHGHLVWWAFQMARNADVAEELALEVWTEVYLGKRQGRPRYPANQTTVLSWLLALAGRRAWARLNR
jgi:DNA-directed RNA polymerase specialized sigma24 family protein